MSKLVFESQISGFTQQRLNQLDHRGTYTNSETNLTLSLSLIHILIQEARERNNILKQPI